MEFFNKKEDVLDIELTPYGEYLLADGKFKPVYYSFFDNEILYDGEYAYLNSEEQSEIKERIKETPRLKTQVVFQEASFPFWYHIIYDPEGPLYGPDGLAEAEPGAAGPHYAQLFSSFHSVPSTKQYTLPFGLGNCSLNTENAPAWNIKFLFGELDSSVTMFTASAHPYLKIPQLNSEIVYETFIKNLNSTQKSENYDNRLSEFEELHENLVTFPNNTTIDFNEDYLVLEITEDNVPFLKENFDIEVFEILTSVNPKKGEVENLRPLNFVKKPTIIDDKGLLKGFEEQEKTNEQLLKIETTELDRTIVEYYFNLYIDHEIDSEVMCTVSPISTEKGVFTNNPLDCEFKESPQKSLPFVYEKSKESSIPECDE